MKNRVYIIIVRLKIKDLSIFSIVLNQIQSWFTKQDGETIAAYYTYIKPVESHVIYDRKKTINGPRVGLPDGLVMKTLETGILPLNNFLSTMAKTGNVLAGLTNSSLLSIGQLCDDDCIAVFSKFKLCV